MTATDRARAAIDAAAATATATLSSPAWAGYGGGAVGSGSGGYHQAAAPASRTAARASSWPDRGMEEVHKIDYQSWRRQGGSPPSSSSSPARAEAEAWQQHAQRYGSSPVRSEPSPDAAAGTRTGSLVASPPPPPPSPHTIANLHTSSTGGALEGPPSPLQSTRGEQPPERWHMPGTDGGGGGGGESCLRVHWVAVPEAVRARRVNRRRRRRGREEACSGGPAGSRGGVAGDRGDPAASAQVVARRR
jgi:hypothetical protein